MKNLPRLFFMLFLPAAILFSCDSKRVFDIFAPLPTVGWDADSIQTYSFNIDDSLALYNIFLNIRNDKSYDFSNLWLFVNIIPPQGESFTDTVQVMLANPMGEWTGKGFSGTYDNQILYRRSIYFPATGTYNIQIQHGMRTKILRGISDIGIRVEKVGSR
ncbi:MAG: gliding motility lipoprotein GldH [Prolixibacteraceae bacterium]|nr:gliding motility lipoprotein GldH [Prolixibacteraceae bacterium]